MMKAVLVLASIFLLAGCASISQQINRSGPLTDEEIANARANDVPVIIYDTSFSHGAAAQPSPELTVRFINVSDKQIDTVTLLVVSCLGDEGVYGTLAMKGPFASKAIYANHPTLDGSVEWSAHQTSQMLIKGADVTFQDGSKQSFGGKDISKLFGQQLSNYCARASDPH